MQKILVLGKNGMLGYAASRYFGHKKYSVTSLSRKEFDVLSSPVSALQSYIKNSGFVINCIGVIKQIIDSYSVTDVLKINCTFPRNLALICKQLKVPLIHVTTDCAFSGSKGSYSEDDFFDAEDLYGISKIAGETSECMTLRTSLIGPENGRNRSLLEWAIKSRGTSVNGYIDHIWNGVTTLYFAELCEKIFIKNLYKSGVFHLHSPVKVSKYELLNIFNEVFSLSLKVNKVNSPEACDRSLSSIYTLSKSIAEKSIRDQVVELKQFFSL